MMSAGLPQRWTQTTLGELAVLIRNGIFASHPTNGPEGVKILRISAVRDLRLNLEEVKFVDYLDEKRLFRFSVTVGDLLFTRYNGSKNLVGRCARVPEHAGPLLHPDKLIRVILPSDIVDSRFIAHQMESAKVRRYIEPRIRTTAGQSGIAGGDIRGIPVVIPPLEEQRRIIEVLEDHLSRLDASVSGLEHAARRIDILEAQTIRAALTGRAVAGPHDVEIRAAGLDDGELATLPRGWCWMRLGEIADVVGGVTKDSNKQSETSFIEVPYLRVANVQRGHLDLNTITNIRVSPRKAEALRLLPGDVLLNEGGDRDKLGRGWVWEGQIENCIHQNHVFRARIRDGRIDPYLLSWAANSIGGRWCERNGKQSVNLASISLSKIRLMPVPVPPPSEQAVLRQHIESVVDGCRIIRREITTSRTRSVTLRRSLLEAAFSGRLTGSTPGIEMAEEMASV